MTIPIAITTPRLDDLYLAVRATTDLPPTLSSRGRRKALRELAEEALAAIPESGDWREAAECAYIGAEAKVFLYTPDQLKKAVKAGVAEGDEIERAMDYCADCPVIAACHVWADKQDPEYRGIAAGQIWTEVSRKGKGPRRAHYRPTPALIEDLREFAAQAAGEETSDLEAAA